MQHLGQAVSTRRRFIKTTTAGLAAHFFQRASHAQRSRSSRNASVPMTGAVDKTLALYDQLMMEFMQTFQPPGASLAVTYQGRLVYARGFGYADVEQKEVVEPTSLFRIASLSKPITSVAVFQLIEQGRVGLDEKVLSIITPKPVMISDKQIDARLRDVTVRHCLQHTAGWDRAKGFGPMSARGIEDAADALGKSLPIEPQDIIQYALGRPLDFDPGTSYAYSNFGYCVLGRVIETISGMTYGDYVAKNVLRPLGITRMRLGKNLLQDRAPDEAMYYDTRKRMGRAISGPKIGERVPLPYGVEALELMDANGGWIASAVDLARFAVAFDHPARCPILSAESIAAMLERPPGPPGMAANGQPKDAYYACGWQVRPRARGRGQVTKWHGGGLAGTQTLLVCRKDGINWAVLFNGDQSPDGEKFAGIIDGPLHRPANEIKVWPRRDLFKRLLQPD